MPICNGCGVDTDTSREHLIHRRVGEALLGVRDHPDTEAMRRELLSGFVRFHGEAGDVSHTGVRLDGTISNLLCKSCNEGWAKRLEEPAGHDLFGFLHAGKTLDLQLFLRWLVFFQFKAHVYYARPERLAGGLLTDLFSGVPTTIISVPVWAGRLEVSDRAAWQFMMHIAEPGSAVSPGFLLVTDGVMWFLPFGSPPSLPLVRLRDGVRLDELPVLAAGLIVGTLIPQRTVDTLGDHA